MRSAYAFVTTARFSFFVGVSSLPSSEKFVGRIVNFWTVKAAFGQHLPFLLADSMAFVTVSIQTWSFMAPLMVLTSEFTRRAPASRLSVPGTSPLAPWALRVTKAMLYLRL